MLKIKVETIKNSVEQVQDLYSYDTLVARIIHNFEKRTIRYEYLGKFSQTTTRHQKEFFKQCGELSDREIKELFENGVMEESF